MSMNALSKREQSYLVNYFALTITTQYISKNQKAIPYHKKNRNKGYNCSTIKILINICFTLLYVHSTMLLLSHNFGFGFHGKSKAVKTVKA